LHLSGDDATDEAPSMKTSDVTVRADLEIVDVLRQGRESVVGDVQFVDGVAERADALREFRQLVVWQIQPAYVLGQS